MYASTLQANEEVNLAFYGALCEAITKIPVEGKLIILGDFNPRVGRDWEMWDSLGRHGIGKISSNGLRLLELCSELKLVICNTCSHHKDKHKYTWFHPRSKQGHLIDYIITRKRDLADVCNVCVLCSAEYDTNHRLVRGKFQLYICKKTHLSGVKVPKQLDVSKLHDPNMCSIVRDELDQLDFDGTLDQFKEQVYSVGLESLGLQWKKHKDWFDKNDAYINQLLSEKRHLYSSLLNQGHQNQKNQTTVKTYKEIKSTFQRDLRRMKNKWWSNISKEVQKASDSKDAETLYCLLNQAFGPTSSLVTPLKLKDNTTLMKDPNKIMLRWQGHFKDLFHNPSSDNDIVIDSIPQL